MPAYAVKDRVQVRIASEIEEGTLIDIDMSTREFKVKIGRGEYWVSYKQIVGKSSQRS